jgi:hypothetical protein
MAKKEDRKKQKKRLREKKKDARQRQHLASMQPSLYPDIVLNADCKDPVFRQAVADTLSRYSYKDDAHCPPENREHYLTIARVGWKAWYERMQEKAYASQSDSVSPVRALQEATLPQMLHFGTWVFEHLPKKYTARFDPEHFFRIDNHGNAMLVSFTLMDCIEDKDQRIYIPQWKPTVQMQGVEWQVGLYSHALDRLCSRLVPQHSITYSNCVDVFHRFSQNLLRFMPTSLADGQEALRVDFSPPLGTVFYDTYAAWVRKVLDLPDAHDFSRDKWRAIVLGYLPLHIQGRYARAKTFLLPGFTKTPEHALGLQKATSSAERQLLRAMTDEDSRTFDLTGDTIAAIKWYHDNGVPQICVLDKAPVRSVR